MVIVKTVRKWDEVSPLASARTMSSRYTLDARSKKEGPSVVIPVWTRFDELKQFILFYLTKVGVPDDAHAFCPNFAPYSFTLNLEHMLPASAQFLKQNAMQIKENLMVLELVQVIHDLLLTGFYRSREVPQIIMPMLQLLDGRKDVLGLDGANGDVDPRARYRQAATIRYNTVIIMKAKKQLCEILQLICTMRLDIRLSLLLGIYHSTLEQSAHEPTGRVSERKVTLRREPTIPIKRAANAENGASFKRGANGESGASFDSLFEVLSFGDVSINADSPSVPGAVASSHLFKSSKASDRYRVAPEPESQRAVIDLVPILLDLTCSFTAGLQPMLPLASQRALLIMSSHPPSPRL